ncbi:MAG: uracil-DNA glycosylase [Clostridiales bacterium]|nr:uracil-DNA glycosylase [Clostridiales bacterium]
MKTFFNEWDNLLAPLFANEKYINIRNFLKKEYSEQTIYPDMHDIFNCFALTDYSSVKAVILGQDPYHGYGQAHGLCFSVKKGVKLPPSLNNIFTELKSDIGANVGADGDLTKWAERGVLLLNTVLTVREGNPNSHKDCGWQWFTDEVIKLLNEREKPIVFILWGANARSKKKFIDTSRHFIVESAHPSPLSSWQGFFGSKPFSKTNELLISAGINPIDWNLI